MSSTKPHLILYFQPCNTTVWGETINICVLGEKVMKNLCTQKAESLQFPAIKFQQNKVLWLALSSHLGVFLWEVTQVTLIMESDSQCSLSQVSSVRCVWGQLGPSKYTEKSTSSGQHLPCPGKQLRHAMLWMWQKRKKGGIIQTL